MEIVKLTTKNHVQIIKRAVGTLQKGGVIIYPTETCYGLGVDATNEQAIQKLLSYKTFRNDKPISVAVCDQKTAQKYVTLNPTAKNLYKEYLPGPFTIISKGKGKVAKGVESNTNTLGIRIPNHKFLLKLLKAFSKPMTSTSANVSYKKAPYEIKDILNNTTRRQQGFIDLIIDAGKLPRNDPSTVIDTTLDDVNILRQGDVEINEEHKITTKSEQETKTFGIKLLKRILKEKHKKPVILALQGELGTGKTQISKAIAKELGITQVVTSPTFIICREYNAKKHFKKLFHIDTYRLLEPREMYEIGFEDMLTQRNLIIIEWADKITDIIKENKDKSTIMWVKMFHKDETERIIEFGEMK